MSRVVTELLFSFMAVVKPQRVANAKSRKSRNLIQLKGSVNFGRGLAFGKGVGQIACVLCSERLVSLLGDMTFTSSISRAQLQKIHLTLQLSPIFHGMSEGETAAIAEICQLRKLDKREILFREGDRYMGFYIVRTGVLKIFKVGVDGREQVLRMVGSGDSFAEAPVGDRRSFPASVQAEKPSEVVLVPVTEFRDQMMRNPELGLRILGSMSSQLRHLVTLIDDLTLKNVEARFALYLLRTGGKMPPQIGQRIEVPVTWQVLATHLGCTSESLSRLLRLLKNRGTVKISGHTVTILDPDSLVAIGEQ